MNRTKLHSMRKLATSKNFVLMTDDESVIFLGGINPNDFTDIKRVIAQQASLETFREKLDELITSFDKHVDKVLGVSSTKPTTKKGKKPVTKEDKIHDKKSSTRV